MFSGVVSADAFDDGHSLTGHFVDACSRDVSGSISCLESNNVPVSTDLIHENLKIFRSRDRRGKTLSGKCAQLHLVL